jgi:hypothetical protein
MAKVSSSDVQHAYTVFNPIFPDLNMTINDVELNHKVQYHILVFRVQENDVEEAQHYTLEQLRELFDADSQSSGSVESLAEAFWSVWTYKGDDMYQYQTVNTQLLTSLDAAYKKKRKQEYTSIEARLDRVENGVQQLLSLMDGLVARMGAHPR